MLCSFRLPLHGRSDCRNNDPPRQSLYWLPDSMKSHQRGLFVDGHLVLMLCMVGTYCAAPSMAETLPIISYSMENGNAGGQTYFDDAYGGPGATGNPNAAGSFLSGGLGQLTNGLFASATDIFDDQWIGWFPIQPTVTIDLGAANLINSVSFHASNNSQFGDVGAPGSANLSYSLDNITFTSLGTYTTTVADRSGDDPRWVDLPFGVVARYARVQLLDGVKIAGTNPGFKPWIFLDEARVDGGSAPPGFSFSDFSSTAGLRFRGSAAKAGTALRLSTAAPYNEGTVFTASPVALANDKSFNTHFRFRITNSAGANDEDGVGADGLVFVVQTMNTGGGLGYSNLGLGIEFDTFNNGAALGDPNGNHVGIDLNGSIVSVQTQSEPIRFNNGEIWNAWVDYNGTADQLEVRWSMNAARPAVAQLTQTVDLAPLFGPHSPFIGFTSATGGGWGDHELLSWEFLGGSLNASSFVADYDSNDQVDAADLARWRAGFGPSPSATHMQGDADGDGRVDGADFLVWQRQLGSGPPVSVASAPVPEPATEVLLALAAAGLRIRRRQAA